jgi:hypothetical protein
MGLKIDYQTASILCAVLGERTYQDRKYGTPAERDLSLADYQGIVRAELNEVHGALVAGQMDDARLEMLQVLAVAWAALERHGVVVREPVMPVGGIR